jgi:hypothetical protein
VQVSRAATDYYIHLEDDPARFWSQCAVSPKQGSGLLRDRVLPTPRYFRGHVQRLFWHISDLSYAYTAAELSLPAPNLRSFRAVNDRGEEVVALTNHGQIDWEVIYDKEEAVC